jgi:acyl-CoA thioesterase I
MYMKKGSSQLAMVVFFFASTLCVEVLAAEPRREAADKATYLADVVRLLEQEWPKNRTINIVCHGHSVPAGYAKTPVVDTFGAYPHLLHKGLKDRFPYAVVNVIVTAIGGETSDRGAERFDRDVLTHRPDVLLIDYGLNDRRIGLAKARQSWASMIEKAQAAGVKVILLTPTADTTAKLDDPNDPINQHARQIRSLAARYRVGCVESLAAFRAYVAAGGKIEELMSQFNHPNRKGHALVAKELVRWFPVPEQDTPAHTSVRTNAAKR